MNTFRKVALLLTVLLSTSAFAGSKEQLMKVKNLRNKVTRVSTGKTTVVQFWASWCLTCGDTMKKIHNMTRKDQSKRFYGVALDEDLGAIKEYIKAKPFMNKFKRKLLWDHNTDLAQKLKVQAVPTIIIFDENGKQIYKREGKPGRSHMKEIRKILKG